MTMNVILSMPEQRCSQYRLAAKDLFKIINIGITLAIANSYPILYLSVLRWINISYQYRKFSKSQ